MSTSKKIEPKHIKWLDAVKKRERETEVLKLISTDIFDMGDAVNVLSYPPTNWLRELNLMNQHETVAFNVTGIESDVDEYEKSERWIAPASNCRMHPNPCNLQEYLDRSESTETFDIIFVDWEDSWSTEKEDSIRSLFEKTSRLNEDGLLILSLSLEPGGPDANEGLSSGVTFVSLYDDNDKDYPEMQRAPRAPEDITRVAGECGVNLSSVLSSSFISSPCQKEGVSKLMGLFIFKRSNEAE